MKSQCFTVARMMISSLLKWMTPWTLMLCTLSLAAMLSPHFLVDWITCHKFHRFSWKCGSDIYQCLYSRSHIDKRSLCTPRSTWPCFEAMSCGSWQNMTCSYFFPPRCFRPSAAATLSQSVVLQKTCVKLWVALYQQHVNFGRGSRWRCYPRLQSSITSSILGISPEFGRWVHCLLVGNTEGVQLGFNSLLCTHEIDQVL